MLASEASFMFRKRHLTIFLVYHVYQVFSTVFINFLRADFQKTFEFSRQKSTYVFIFTIFGAKIQIGEKLSHFNFHTKNAQIMNFLVFSLFEFSRQNSTLKFTDFILRFLARKFKLLKKLQNCIFGMKIEMRQY